MNVYFTASISQKNQYGKHYTKIVDTLKKFGHKIVHEHITSHSSEDVNRVSESGRIEFYKKVQKWISEADLVVAEVSYPSTLNVGHEITMALERGKPIIALYLQGKNSVFFDGLRSEKFIYEEYTPTTLESILKQSLDLAQDSSDVRFNFIISPSLLEYLDWIAKTKKLPRSVYLRKLIELDREKNKEYQG